MYDVVWRWLCRRRKRQTEKAGKVGLQMSGSMGLGWVWSWSWPWPWPRSIHLPLQGAGRRLRNNIKQARHLSTGLKKWLFRRKTIILCSKGLSKKPLKFFHKKLETYFHICIWLCFLYKISGYEYNRGIQNRIKKGHQVTTGILGIQLHCMKCSDPAEVIAFPLGQSKGELFHFI